MTRFNDKKVFIAPYTPISNAYKKYLLSNTHTKFQGFIDKIKDGDEIYKIENIEDYMFDYIIIISPNHHLSIYNDYTSFFPKGRLCIVEIQNNLYTIKPSPSNISTNKIKYYSNLIDKNQKKRDGIVFINKGFITANNKYLYLACVSKNISAHLLTDNIEQLKILQKEHLPCELLGSDNGDKIIANSKYIVFDQANYTYFSISKEQITVQLWHGVGLKKMSKLDNIVYDYFISTSNWTNETNFKNIFLSKNYLNCGYPRNDFLTNRSHKESEMLFCDSELLKISKKSKTVLYMPTTREYLFAENGKFSLEDILPLDLTSLDVQLKKLDIIFILKLHPFVLEFFKNLIIEYNFSHIKFHPVQGDIYPILKYTDILITDYSSVAYDFLLLDRPIIFFNYDQEKYEKNMDGLLFDYDEYSPGEKVKTQEELIKAIQSEDRYKEKRLEIKNKFFDTHDISASEYIIQNIFKKDI